MNNKTLKNLMVTAVTLFLFSIIFQAGLSLNRTIASSTYYENSVRQADLSSLVFNHLDTTVTQVVMEKLHTEVASRVPEGLETERFNHQIKQFVEVIGSPFEINWIDEQIETITVDVLAVVNGEQQNLESVIDLTVIKDQFTSNIIDELGRFSQRNQELLGVNPEVIETFMQKTDIPNYIVLQDLLDGSGASRVTKVIIALARLRLFYLILPIVAFPVLFFLFYKKVGFYQGAKWFGASLIASSIFFYTVVTIALSILNKVLSSSTKLSNLAQKTIIDLITYTNSRITIMPFLILLVGLLIIAFAVVIPIVQGEKIRV